MLLPHYLLQAGDKHYHPTCARCSRCDRIFKEGEEMYLQGQFEKVLVSGSLCKLCIFVFDILPAVCNCPCFHRVNSLAPRLQRQQQNWGQLQGKSFMSRVLEAVFWLRQTRIWHLTHITSQNTMLTSSWYKIQDVSVISVYVAVLQHGYLNTVISLSLPPQVGRPKTPCLDFLFPPQELKVNSVSLPFCAYRVLWSERAVISCLEINRTRLFHMQHEHFAHRASELDLVCQSKEAKRTSLNELSFNFGIK